MASSDYVFGNKQWEINRWILVLSTLGLATKVLEIDLSQVPMFGLNLQGEEAALVPGFIGIALTYALLAFIIARIELMLAHNTSTAEHVVPVAEKIAKSKLLSILAILSLPIPVLMYFLIPIGLSAFTLVVLYDDIWTVIQLVWAAA